jgi:hypothetical protein
MEPRLILLGCLGGMIPDVIRLIKLGDTGDYTAPDYLRKGFFYFILLLQILFGALMVYVFKVQDNLQALVYGYAAPQIFTSAASAIIKRSSEKPMAPPAPAPPSIAPPISAPPLPPPPQFPDWHHAPHAPAAGPGIVSSPSRSNKFLNEMEKRHKKEEFRNAFTNFY